MSVRKLEASCQLACYPFFYYENREDNETEGIKEYMVKFNTTILSKVKK